MEELREHLNFIPLGLLADLADRRIFLPFSNLFWLPSFPPQYPNIWKTNIQMALYAMHHIQKACASDLKPGFQFSEGWDPRPHLQGTTQQLILSQRRWQARLEHMYQDNKKDSLPEEKAEDKVQSFSNDNQVGQPNKECRKVTCHRTLRCHVRLNECPSAEVWDWSFPRTPKYLFQSKLQHNIHSHWPHFSPWMRNTPKLLSWSMQSQKVAHYMQQFSKAHLAAWQKSA